MAGAGLFLPPCRSCELRENCRSFVSNRSVCVGRWDAGSAAWGCPDLLEGHNTACVGILVMPGTCLLERTRLVLPKLVPGWARLGYGAVHALEGAGGGSRCL